MLRRLVAIAAIIAVFGLAAFWVLTIPQTVPASALGPHTPNLANGKEMFIAGGCESCHAVPKQEDKTRLGGGLGLRSPFGVFYVPNISPDKTDGIGGWTEAQFVTAMVKGTSPAGEHLYPAFPYPSYQHMSFDDLRDLFAYLKTLPPVTGKVRDHDLPFPFNIRRQLGEDVELLHDMHERVPPILAMQLARYLEPYRPYFLEDPFAPEDVGYFKISRPQTSTPIAMGELFNNPNEWVPLVSGRLIDFIRIHLSQVGGLTMARKVAALCEFFGVRSAWHGPGDVSPVGHAANVHLDLAAHNFGIQEARDLTPAFPAVSCKRDRNGRE